MVTFIQVSTLDTQTSCIFVRLWAALAVILLARNPAKKKNGPTLDVTISRKEAAKEVVLSIYTPNSYSDFFYIHYQVDHSFFTESPNYPREKIAMR
jgi:hypothetical protein